MALKLLSDSDLPPATRGVGAASEPKVTITSVGQFRFNKLAGKVFAGCTHIQLAWDAEKRVLGFVGTSNPKDGGVTYENKADKKGALYLSGSRVCRLIGWDYAFSGNWSGECKVDADKNRIIMTLPDPQPAAPPKKPRKPRKAKEETTTTEAAPADTEGGENLNLDME